MRSAAPGSRPLRCSRRLPSRRPNRPGGCRPRARARPRAALTPARRARRGRDDRSVPARRQFGIDRLAVLERYLPDFLWTNRDRFFYEGMRLEIGPCFRDYGAPDFFVSATEQGRGRRSSPRRRPLGLDGRAPLPSGRDRDGCARRRAALALERAEPLPGRRLPRPLPHDRPGRQDRPRRALRGRDLQADHHDRADRPGYEAPGAKDRIFVAGGLFTSRSTRASTHGASPAPPRCYRREPLRRSARVPAAVAARPAHRRRAHRGASTCRRFAVGMAPTQVLPARRDGRRRAAIGAIQVPGDAGGTIQTKRSGYEGLEFRPLLYDVKVLGLHDVLAPINASTPSYPDSPERDFGPLGLSFASDRWDLRRALVLELRTQGGRRLRDRAAPGALRGPPDAPAALRRDVRREERDDERGHVRRALERGPRGLSALARRPGARGARDRPGRRGLREPRRARSWRRESWDERLDPAVRRRREAAHLGQPAHEEAVV